MATTTRKRVTTHDYPTRYAAFDAPGTWAIYVPRSGRRPNVDAAITYPGEVAVLHVPEPNRHWPGLTDGAYVVVRGLAHGGTRWTVTCHYTAPTPDRRQTNAVKQCSSLDAAIATAESWIAKAAGWAA